MTKINQTVEQLEKILSEKWKSIKQSCELYDSGKRFTALSLATDLRVLLHDTTRSTSLLSQLSKKNMQFFDSSVIPPGKLFGPYIGLYATPIGGDEPCYVPYLDQSPNSKKRYITFDRWWNQVVIRDGKGKQFSRKDVVLYVADQGGGAHVDPALDENYANLSQNNSVGWKTSTNGEPEKQIQDGDRAAVRQIAHEVIRTFFPDFPIQKFNLPKGTMALAGMGGFAFSHKDAFKIGRNDDCPCGATKEDGRIIKFKKCHGA